MKQKNSLKLLLLSLVISSLLHFFFILKYRYTATDPVQSEQHQSRNQDPPQDLDDGKTSIWVSPGVVPCDSYEGIGVQFNAITGIVTHVASNAPADKAGLQIGDELVTPLWSMELAFGQKIDLVIVRDGKRLTMPVIVDRICHQ